MKLNKKFMYFIFFSVSSLSLVGCSSNKKNEPIPIEKTQEEIDAEIEREIQKNKSTSIRQSITVDENDNKLLYLNSLLKNGSKILDLKHDKNQKTYILSAPLIPPNQKEISDRKGSSFIEVVTSLENGLETEKEIKIIVQNNLDNVIDINLPEMILVEKIYGVSFKDGSSIYTNHKKNYINSNYKSYAIYNKNTLLNNVWSIDLKSQFFGYNNYGNDVEKTITLTLSRTPNNLLPIYNDIYKSLIRNGFSIKTKESENLLIFTNQEGLLKTDIKLYPTSLELIQKGNSEQVYANWDKNLRYLSDIDIYKVLQIRDIQENTKNILNYTKDIPYKLSNTNTISIPTKPSENSYKVEFKALSAINKNEDFVVEIYLEEDKLNNTLELRTKIIPLFLKN